MKNKHWYCNFCETKVTANEKLPCPECGKELTLDMPIIRTPKGSASSSK